MTLIDYQPGRVLKWSVRLGLVGVLLAYVVSSRYFLNVSWPDSGLGIAYLVSSYVGHFAFLALLLWLLVIIPIALIVPHQMASRGLIALVMGMALVLLLGDTFVFQQYRFHLNMFIWKLIAQDKNNEIFDFSALTKGIAFLILFIFCGGLYWLSEKLWRTIAVKFPAGRLLFCALLVYLGANFIHIWANAQYLQSITRFNQYFPAFYPATAHKFMAKHGWLNENAQEANRAVSIDREKTSIQYPLEELAFREPVTPPNILIIAIDSWRGDEMNERVSPNMFAFSEGAIRYENHQSGSNSTRTGIFSLFYGLPGVYWDAMFANKRAPILLDLMQKHQFDFGIFASAGLANPEFDRTVFSQIVPLRTQSDGDSPAMRDKDLTEDWLAWLDQQQASSQSPFFGFLFYDAPHGYSTPPQFSGPFQPETGMNYLALSPDYDPTKVRNRYRNSIYYDDQLIGEVLDDLEKRQLLSNTIVIITADHGQEFNDNHKNYWGHGSNFSEAQTHVPMIVFWPGKEPHIVTRQTTHFDIVPTLVRDVFGVTSPDTSYSTGGDLFSPVERPWLIAGSYKDFAIIEKERITVSGLDGGIQVFDRKMNEIEQPELNVSLLNKAMAEMRRFYR